MDAVEGLGTTVLAAVTAETAETLLVERDCITGGKKREKERKKKNKEEKNIKFHTL